LTDFNDKQNKPKHTPQEVDWTRPTAFVLGNERDGVSPEAVAMADQVAVVPMAGGCFFGAPLSHGPFFA
jgi:tRNA G18 (ribose-2'-O)-methylase SpoU